MTAPEFIAKVELSGRSASQQHFSICGPSLATPLRPRWTPRAPRADLQMVF